MIESEDIKLNIEKIELNDILIEIQNDFGERIAKRGDQLIIPNVENILLNVDKEKIITVLNNLITNAINYSDSGDIVISVKKHQKQVRISVIDNGIGMPEKYFEDIFNRFFRIDKNRSNISGGTGLGLAIVKHILLAHNSKANVKSTKGIGTEISFMLPILKS